MCAYGKLFHSIEAGVFVAQRIRPLVDTPKHFIPKIIYSTASFNNIHCIHSNGIHYL